MELPKLLNDFIYKILKAEVKVMNRINLPAGTTIVTVASK
jgi:hypothetical protein